MKRKTRIITTALFILCIAFLSGIGEIHAQHKHELSVDGGGGLSNLQYKAATGEKNPCAGFDFGLGYHYFFSPKWGLLTGAELARYSAKYSMSGTDIRYMTPDSDGNVFEFRSTVNAYSDRQNALYLQIPLMLQFQAGDKHQFYMAAGCKAGIPMDGNYKTTATIVNAGYYAYENSLYDTQTFMGFGRFPDRKTAGALHFKSAFFLAVETGVKWRLSDLLSFYSGVYLDYGLNDISPKPADASIVEYNSAHPPAFAVNSILVTQYAPSGGATQPFADKVTPLAAGVRLRLSFGVK